MSFVDEIVLYARAGKGGDGSSSIRREPYKPLGGPDGGNGGDGGSVVLEVSAGVRDLSALADHPHQKAKSGVNGGGNNRHGATARDRVLRVPDGTVVRDQGELIADLVGEGARVVIARGGRGGRGNAALVSRRNRIPRHADAGEPGEEKRLELELRLVADVGLVGLPNAGKSTLLSKLTAARPKIADYPFTTLTPNLGVGEDDAGHRYVLADIPGLVEGASEGRGLGDRFLRHISRCRALVFVVDLASEDPRADLRTVREEVAAYDPQLAERPSIVVAAKADLVNEVAGAALGRTALVVSAVTGEGLQTLADRLAELVREAVASAPEREPFVVLRPGRPSFVVRREGQRFRVVGRNVERWVLETDLEDPGRVVALQNRLVKEGVERQLAAAGARRGDEVIIGDRVFEYIPEVFAGEKEE